jgi:hypothetical protein
VIDLRRSREPLASVGRPADTLPTKLIDANRPAIAGTIDSTTQALPRERLGYPRRRPPRCMSSRRDSIVLGNHPV